VASIYELKPRFQALLRPLVDRLAAFGITANQVTIATLILSLVGGALVMALPNVRAVLLLMPVLLFVRMALNAIDGMLAREHNMKSPVGAMLNELGDVLADAAMYLPLVAVDAVRPGPVVAFVVLGIISEMAGVAAVQIGAERRYDGPLGKSDRAFAVGVIYFLLGLGIAPGRWHVILLVTLAALAVMTIVRRSRQALASVGPASAHRP
jgi:CDP-diacylglycerol--glycerol-3-phosphate 3-phosphatidyltransferase